MGTRIQKSTPSIVKNSVRIVAIGASAGGLEAFEQFFDAMPVDSGLAFVLVSHMDPERKGMMPELLQRVTAMKVSQIDDRMVAQPNRVYIIPPNKDLSIQQGIFHLAPPSEARGLRLPIDGFFRSLAQEQRERAIGVILSGMGSDGTLGLTAIKENMGMVMVQDPKSAKFQAMLQSAMETGLVDYVAPANELPAKLLEFIRTESVSVKELQDSDTSHPWLEKVIAIIRTHTGHDFTLYKQKTLGRRVERRMSVNQIERFKDYLRYLEESAPEREILFKELLIGVTNFFRDPEAFKALAVKALPRLLKERVNEKFFRVWVPGCSSGEEAYSIAMLIMETLESAKLTHEFQIQIFATDLDKTAIEKARHGIYPANISADVTPERLKRFFKEIDSKFQLRKEIRDMVIFAPHNIIKDPPFTKLDLICCRNLLIYFVADLQNKIIPLFHYSLRSNGVLFLGPAENVFAFQHLFRALDRKWKIFLRLETAASRSDLIQIDSRTPSPSRSIKSLPVPLMSKQHDTMLPTMINQVLLTHGTPPAVIVDAQGDILYIHGHTGNFLEPSSGKFNNNIYAMAREGLRYELAGGLKNAAKRQTPVELKALRIKNNNIFLTVDVLIRPLNEPSQMKGSFLVIFKAVPLSAKRGAKRVPKGRQGGNTSAIRSLHEEIQSLRDRLQTVTDEIQNSQEELKSTNEELQSTNEELQSTNEELMTSKEEMQSLNEELMSVNAELQTKIEDLSRTNSDMKNLLSNSNFATIFLDSALNIRRFTLQAARIINLIPTDVGRPLAHIVSNLKYDHLLDDVKQVIETLANKECEVETQNNDRYLMRIMPYRTLDDVIDGAVLTFVDISYQKKTQEKKA
ncbi:MAG: chemotaxis protein CheB [Fibrobacterota bacterium]